MKIIYIFELRHCYTYDNDLFQFDLFRDAKYDVEVWSMVNWTFKGCPIPKNVSNEGYVHYINSETDLKYELQRISKTSCYFLCYPYDDSFSEISYCIRKNIKNSGFSYSNIAMTQALANKKYLTGRMGHLIEYFKTNIKIFIYPFYATCKFIFSKSYRKLYPALMNKSVAKLKGSVKYKSDYNFIRSQVSKYVMPCLLDGIIGKTILCPSGSYDENLQMLNKQKLFNEQYIVFIDQFLVGHSDLIKYGKTLVNNAENYYENLKNLFDEIEKQYKCKVIIAAHPKAEYKGDEFGNRPIIYFKTNLLIRDAKFVILQFSTSLNLITLLKKPFLNIYDRQFFNDSTTKKCYGFIQSFFKCKQLDISNYDYVKNFEKFIYPYRKKIYDKHNEEYVCAKKFLGTEQTFYEIVFEKLKSNGCI